MLIALDVHYRAVSEPGLPERAKAVGVSFATWTDADPIAVEHVWVEAPAPYVPGQFYARELPCLLAVLKRFDWHSAEAIVVDGYVTLDDGGRAGLGRHLYEALGQRVPIVGVAKRAFAKTGGDAAEVLRGRSANPLYVTAVGLELDEAVARVRGMHGAHRTPTLLRTLDYWTKHEA